MKRISFENIYEEFFHPRRQNKRLRRIKCFVSVREAFEVNEGRGRGNFGGKKKTFIIFLNFETAIFLFSTLNSLSHPPFKRNHINNKTKLVIPTKSFISSHPALIVLRAPLLRKSQIYDAFHMFERRSQAKIFVKKKTMNKARARHSFPSHK